MRFKHRLECELIVSPLGVKILANGKETSLPIRYSSKHGGFISYERRSGILYGPGVVFGVEDYGHGAILWRDILYVIKEVKTVEAPEEESKENLLKVYETPKKTVELFVSFLVKRTREYVLNRIKDEKLKAELGALPLKEFMPAVYRRWEELKKAGLRLSEPPVFPVFDPQAGSGKALLELFDEYGLKGYLYGVEVRKIKSDDERYRVLTGIDVLAFNAALMADDLCYYDSYGRIVLKPNVPQWFVNACKEANVPVQTARRALANLFYFMNPPYVAQGRSPVVEETYLTFPLIAPTEKGYVSGLGFVVSSHVQGGMVSRNYSDLAVSELTYDQVGYSHSVPEKYLVGFVRKRQEFLGVQRTLEDGIPISDEEWERILEDNLVASKVLDKVMERLGNTASRIQSVVQRASASEVLRAFDLRTEAVQNKPVFPGLHLVDGRYLTFEEVLHSPLLDIYKKRFPQLYELVEYVAQVHGVRLPSAQVENYGVLGFKLQGFMKYAYVPPYVSLTDRVKEILLSLAPEDQRAELKLLLGLPEAEEVWIKSGFSTVTSSEGDVAFGAKNFLVLTDKVGNSLAVLPASVSDFYDKLIDEGIVSPTLKSVFEHPKASQMVLKLLQNFVSYVKAVRSLNDEEKNLVASIVEEKNPLVFHGKLINLSAKLFHRWSSQGRLLREQVLGFDAYEDASDWALESLRSMGLSQHAGKVKELFQELKKSYKKSEYLFLSCLHEVDKDQEKLYSSTYLGGKPVREYLKGRLEALGLDGVSAERVADAFVYAMDPYASLVLSGRIAQSVKRLVYAYAYAIKIEKALRDGNWEEGLKLLEELFTKAVLTREDGTKVELETLGFLPYQFRYGLEMGLLQAINYLEGKPANAILGMAPRSGKTLSALWQGMVFYLLTGEKFYFGVRSVNFFDVVHQGIEFMPFMAENFSLAPSGSDEGMVEEEYLGRFLNPLKTAPNPFYRTAELFKEGGDGVRKALQRDGLGLLEDFIKSPDEDLLSYAQRRPYWAVMSLSGFSQEVRKGLVCYLAHLDKKGYFKQSASWGNVLNAWANLSKAVEEDARSQEDRDRPFVIFSKDGHGLAINYRVRYDRKELLPGCYATADAVLSKGLGSGQYFVVTEKGLNEVLRLGNDYKDFPALLQEVGVLDGQKVYVAKEEDILGYLPNSFLEVRGEWAGIVKAEKFIYDLTLASERGRDRSGILKSKYGFPNVRPSGRLDFPFLLPFYAEEEKGKNLVSYVPMDDNVLYTTIELQGGKVKLTYVYPPDYRPYTQSSESNARPFIYLSDALKGCVTIDEADAGLASEESHFFRLLSSLSSNPDVAVTVMSGTITNGRVAMPAGILKFLSGSGIDSTAIFAQKIQKNYGILEVKGIYEGFFVKLLEVYEKLLLSNRWKEFTEELVDTRGLWDKAKVVIGWADSLGLLTPEQERAFDGLLRELIKVDAESFSGKEVPKKFVPMFNFFRHFTGLVEQGVSSSGQILHHLSEAMERAGILKEGVGTGDLVGFARSLAVLSVPSVFGNRETLQGKAEEINVLDRVDMDGYRQSKTWPYGYQESVFGGLKVLSGAENLEKVVALGLYDGLCNMAGGESLRTLFDAFDLERVSYYSRSFGDYLLVVKGFEEVLRQERSVAHLACASGKTTSDSLSAVVEDLIKNGQSSASEDKVAFAKEFIQALSGASISVRDVEEKDGRKKSVVVVEVKLRGKDYQVKVPAENLSLGYQFLGTVLKTVPKADLNVVFDLAEGRGWKSEVFKDKNPSYPVKVNLVFSDFEEVVDVIHNRGLVESFKEVVSSGQSCVVLTSRVHIMPVVLGDLLTELLENKPASAQVQVLVLVKDDRVRDFVRRLDLDYLRSKGIVLKAEASQASIERELTAFRSALTRGQEPPQTIAFAPMQSVARGVDFSGIGPIFAFGFLQGSNAIQLSYRGENAKGATSFWHAFGTPSKAIVAGDNTREVPTATCFKTERALASIDFSRRLLSGSELRQVGKIVYLQKWVEEKVKKHAEEARLRGELMVV